ncbi:MAG: CpsD/CapB family tyrosine-protein kinase, partial [Mangrovicoccus sp.]
RCGKTMTTANLAFSLARQADLKVMVLELDLRRPSLARVLGIKEPHYFAKALAGSERPEDHLVRIGDNLAFGTNQAAATDPSELLQSSAAQNALEEIEATYQPDILLFDSAPMLASDDTFGFLKNVDAALIVAAAEQTTIEEIDVTEAQVAEATEVMGVVLNKCRYAGGQYGYSSYGAN